MATFNSFAALAQSLCPTTGFALVGQPYTTRLSPKRPVPQRPLALTAYQPGTPPAYAPFHLRLTYDVYSASWSLNPFTAGWDASGETDYERVSRSWWNRVRAQIEHAEPPHLAWPCDLPWFDDTRDVGGW